MFVNNYLYELPDDIQSYIFLIKNNMDYENEMKENLKFCMRGNTNFYNHISNKYSSFIYVDNFIQSYYTIPIIDMIKRTFIIRYINEMVRKIISQKTFNSLIKNIKIQFEKNVKEYHNDKDNSKYSYNQLKKQFDLIKRLLDDTYYRIIVK